MQYITAGIIDNGIKLYGAIEAEPIRGITVTTAESQCRAADAHITIVKAIGKKEITLICRSKPNRKKP